MVRLHNGFAFKYCCASGALGFDGRGYWWERLFLNPERFVFITKTLTFQERKGYYRWWKPWKTFRINRNYTLNSLGLPNPGYMAWIHKIYPKIKHPFIIPSICPFSPDEARLMVLGLNKLNIQAIEVNISCPNTVEKFNPLKIIVSCLDYSNHPIIVKIGVSHNYLRICKEFSDSIVIDAINAVPWSVVNKDKSPLHPFEGGTSSKATAKIARFILSDIKDNYPEIQVISGNGIFDYNEAKWRFDLKADAISFGTIFITKPWRPEQIIRKLENGFLIPTA